jgi:hypothetical protein
MSGGDWFARRYHTGDLDGVSAYSIAKVPSRIILRACTIQIAFQNDPVVTGLAMKVYRYRAGIKTLVATSTNSWTTASIKAHFENAYAYGRKHIYFEFKQFSMDADTEYAFALYADSYVGDYSSHIGWIIDYPNPVMDHAAENNIGELSQIGGVLNLIEQNPLTLESDKYLVRIAPRRYLDQADKTLQGTSGAYSTYYWSFSYNPVTVEINGRVITETNSIPTNTERYYWDSATNRLYLCQSTSILSGWPTTTIATVTYYLHFSTEPVYTYETPTNSATDKVHWEPWLLEVPSVSRTVTDALVGFIPIIPTGLTIQNYTQFFNNLFISTSFNKCEIKMWKYQEGEIVVPLISTLISDVSTDYNAVRITVEDDTEIFNNEIRPNQDGESDYYFSSDFAGLEPSAEGYPKRIVYGSNYLKLINLDYSTSTSGTDNQEWGVMAASMAETDSLIRSFYHLIDFGVGKTTVGAPTTRIYLSLDTNQFTSFVNSNEYMLLQNSITAYSDPPTYGSDLRNITAVNIGSKYFDINSAFTFMQVAGENAFVPQVPFVWYGTSPTNRTLAYGLLNYYGRKSNGSANIKFFTSPITSGDTVVALVNGVQFTDTDFSDSWTSTISDRGYGQNCAFRGIGILYEILVNYAGIAASNIDKATFLAEVDLSDSVDVSFALPETTSGQFPKIKDVINKLLLSCSGMRLFKNADLNWTISRLAPFATEDLELNDNFIQAIDSQYTHSDVYSDIKFRTSFAEVSATLVEDSYYNYNYENLKAKHLYKIDRQKEIDVWTLPPPSLPDFDGLVENIVNVFNARQGRHSIKIAKDIADNIGINDEHNIVREKIGGLAYVDGTEQTLKSRVVEVRSNKDNYTIIVDDQLGLGDNE